MLALILAGGAGSRLDVLTEGRAKPALPFGGAYRLIDFPLSNCAHSGLTDVWVVEQYEPYGLNAHLANGRPWDLDRLHGGLHILPPYLVRNEGEDGPDSPDRSGFATGNADALYRNRHHIREFAPDLLLVLSADHVYRMDYRDLIDAHLANADAADLTLAAVRVPREEASRFGNLDVAPDGRVTRFEYKPDEPESDLATAEVFLYDAPRLLDELDRLGEEARGADASRESPGAQLKDFGDALLPRLVERGRVRAVLHEGYWRDVGTVQSYVAAHLDLLAPAPPLVPDDPAWPVRTLPSPRLPARLAEGCRVEESLVAPGCSLAGMVMGSVLSPGVHVERGAEVRRSVLLDGVTVAASATVENAVLDERAFVAAGARVGGPGEVTLVGRDARIEGGAVVPPGARVKPGETVTR